MSKLYAWGYNTDGQLGLGDTDTRYVPTQVGTDTSWDSIAAGDSHSLAIKNGKLYAWGANYSGQLGLDDTDNRDVPTQVGTDTDWSLVVCGGSFSLAFKTDGSLYSWGENWYGQLGLGDTDHRYVPTQVGADTDWDWIAAGSSHTLAIKTDGSLYTCGNNYYGQLGLGDNDNRDVLTQVGTDTDWTSSTTLRGLHTLIIKTDGSLYACGDNYDGQLGLGDNDDRNSLTQVGTDTDWDLVAGGGYHSLGIRTDGSLYSWGENDRGQLGLGDTDERNIPVQVGTDTDWNLTSAGDDFTLVVKTNGNLYTCGRNDKGQLGLGDADNRHVLVLVETDFDWNLVIGGWAHSLGMDVIEEGYVGGPPSIPIAFEEDGGSLYITVTTITDEIPVAASIPIGALVSSGFDTLFDWQIHEGIVGEYKPKVRDFGRVYLYGNYGEGNLLAKVTESGGVWTSEDIRVATDFHEDQVTAISALDVLETYLPPLHYTEVSGIKYTIRHSAGASLYADYEGEELYEIVTVPQSSGNVVTSLYVFTDADLVNYYVGISGTLDWGIKKFVHGVGWEDQSAAYTVSVTDVEGHY